MLNNSVVKRRKCVPSGPLKIILRNSIGTLLSAALLLFREVRYQKINSDMLPDVAINYMFCSNITPTFLQQNFKL